MRVFVTGATGLIGRRVVADRIVRGDRVVALSRDAARAQALLGAEGGLDIVEGDPMGPGPWGDAVRSCRAVVHLAGAGVADRRWTAAYKKVLVGTRVESTRQVVEALRRCDPRPAVLVNASAVGWYGDGGGAELRESAPAGDDFLARLCVRWEERAREAEALGVRVVIVRFGVVLDPRGGALRRMLPVFRLGLGGPLGSGRQYLPWIHWRDVTGLIDLALRDEVIRGPVNAVAPEAVTNREFARILGAVVRRPAFLPVPRAALRIMLGEVADTATASQHVVPAAALERGYRFEYPGLRAALESLVAE